MAIAQHEVHQRHDTTYLEAPQALPELELSNGDPITLQEIVSQRLAMTMNERYTGQHLEQHIIIQDIPGLWSLVHSNYTVNEKQTAWREPAMIYTGGYLVELLRQTGEVDGARAIVSGMLQAATDESERRYLAGMLGFSLGTYINHLQQRVNEGGDEDGKWQLVTQQLTTAEECRTAIHNAVIEADFRLVPSEGEDQEYTPYTLQINNRPDNEVFFKAYEVAREGHMTEAMKNLVHYMVADRLQGKRYRQVEQVVLYVDTYEEQQQELEQLFQQQFPQEEEEVLMARAVNG